MLRIYNTLLLVCSLAILLTFLSTPSFHVHESLHVCKRTSPVGATAVDTNNDYLIAPPILDTFEANEALSSVFGVTGKGGGLEDDPKNIKNPEQLRLRRVFDHSAHGNLEEGMEPGECVINTTSCSYFDTIQSYNAIGVTHNYLSTCSM